MGNPDLPTAPHIVAKLAEAARDPRAHRYSASRGIPGLRRAQAGYYARRFDVELDPETRGHRHARLEGGPRQPRAGDHLAGRHRAGAQPQLSDPSLRLHHRRRLGAPHPGAGCALDDRVPARRSSARCEHSVPQADRAGPELSRRTRRRRSSTSISMREVVDFCKRHEHLDPVAISPMPRSTSTAIRRRRCCRCRARATSRSSSPR